MISFVMKLLEGQTSLNDLLGKFSPTMIAQSLCVVIEDNNLYLVYGSTPNGLIADFTPTECVFWMCDANRWARTTWKMCESKEVMASIIRKAGITQTQDPDKDIAFNILCRLVETVNQPKRKERLTSDDLDKGLVDLGRRPPEIKWVVNYVTGGLTFRSKTESVSKATLEDYCRSIMLNEPFDNQIEKLSKAWESVNVN